MTVKRYDVGEISGVERTDQGFIRCVGRLTRTGVFTYRLDNGTVRKELRIPDEVFNADSVGSFRLAPLTNDHPGEALTSDNTRRFQVGTVADPKRADAFVESEIQITDKAAISDVMDKGKRELSCGYVCDLDFAPGTTKGIEGIPDGLKFDAIQRNIRGNHVALVSSGRAGREASLRLDSEDAVQQDGPTPRSDPMLKKLTIDGIDCEMTETSAQVVSRVMARIDGFEEKLTELTKAVATEKARADTAEEKATETQKKLDTSASPEAMAKAVKARVDLEQKARAVLGADVTLDGIDELDIMKAVVIKSSKADDIEAKITAADETYVRARFDQALEGVDVSKVADVKKADVTPTTVLTNLIRGGTDQERTDENSADAARQRMIEDSQNAGRKPLGASRAKEALEALANVIG